MNTQGRFKRVWLRACRCFDRRSWDWAKIASTDFALTDDDLIFVTTTLTDTKEKAVFGELTWDINDTVSLTAGGRWYDTSIDAVNSADGFANSGPSSYDESQSENGFQSEGASSGRY